MSISRIANKANFLKTYGDMTKVKFKIIERIIKTSYFTVQKSLV